MEAAHVPWRPLGELFVDRGLISEEELETALAEQAATGRRLGEILVECGLVSGPDLTSTLMDQLGVEVAKEDGYGSGLWAEIKRRHRRAQPDDPYDGAEDVDEEEPEVVVSAAPIQPEPAVEPEAWPTAAIEPLPILDPVPAVELEPVQVVDPRLEEELEEIRAEYTPPAEREPEPVPEPVTDPEPEPELEPAPPEPESLAPVSVLHVAMEPQPAVQSDDTAALRAELEEARTELAHLQEMLADAKTTLAALSAEAGEQYA